MQQTNKKHEREELHVSNCLSYLPYLSYKILYFNYIERRRTPEKAALLMGPIHLPNIPTYPFTLNRFEQSRRRRK